MIYELMQVISTYILAISSMLSTKKSVHYFTKGSIFKKSAEINIDTTFFMSKRGPLAGLTGSSV
jgi:hypothetical protein